VHHDGGVIRFTCSFGVAQRLPHEEPLTSILTRADLALYEAKRAGRNLVRAARSGIAAEPATVA
jgi:PleD family two-component response regulator